MKATEKQIGMICYQMKKHNMPTDIPLSFVENELELGEASMIIKSCMDGNPKAGYAQLKHLFNAKQYVGEKNI